MFRSTSFKSPVFRALLVGCAALGIAGHAAAQPSSAPPITLPDALGRAVQGNPGLARFPFRSAAADALRDQAARRRNPELNLEVENVLGSGAYGGTDSAEISLGLSQVLERGGKRGLRADAAEASKALVSDEQRIAELDVVAETARRFVAVVEAQSLSELAAERVKTAERAAAQAEVRVESGRSSAVEKHKARVAVLEARLAADVASRNLEIARRELAAMFGRAEPDFGAALGDLYALPDIGSLTDLEARVLAGPDLARFASARRRAEVELALAQSVSRQDLTLAGGVRRFEATGDNAFTLSVSMPLGLADRNQGNIAAARANLGERDAEIGAARSGLRTLLATAWSRLEQARAGVVTLRGEMRIEAEQALAVSEQGYAAGRLSWLELRDAQDLLLAVRSDAIRIAADSHRLRIELERLVGRAIDAP